MRTYMQYSNRYSYAYLCIEQHAVLRLLFTKSADISSYQPLEKCASILTSDPHQGPVL
jgi:hypothetical protein